MTGSRDVAYRAPDAVRVVAVVGTGSVGARWAALFLAHGLEVVAHDPAAGAATRTIATIVDAWPALHALEHTRDDAPPLHRLRFVATIAEAVAAADVVQENVPEQAGPKAAVMAEIGAAAPAERIVLSSTGGMSPTLLQSWCAHPERVVVLHPFNPAHLVPLVEVVGGERTDPRVVAWAMSFARRVGKRPIRLRREAAGHLTNRLQFALLREAVHCLVEGIASPADIETAVSYGLAPRWASMGSLLTLHLAGGEAGMRGILDHAGDAIETWWAPSTTTRLDASTRALLVAAADEAAEGASIADWIRWRDDALVGVLRQQARNAFDAPSARAREGTSIENDSDSDNDDEKETA